MTQSDRHFQEVTGHLVARGWERSKSGCGENGAEASWLIQVLWTRGGSRSNKKEEFEAYFRVEQMRSDGGR